MFVFGIHFRFHKTLNEGEIKKLQTVSVATDVS